MSQNIASVHKK